MDNIFWKWEMRKSAHLARPLKFNSIIVSFHRFLTKHGIEAGSAKKDFWANGGYQ